MSDLRWTKREVKWGKVDYNRQIWVRPGYIIQNGKISAPDGFEEKLSTQLDHLSFNGKQLDQIGPLYSLMIPKSGWLADVLANPFEGLRSRAVSLLATGTVAVTGCIETDIEGATKTQFRGRQLAAYRFIFCILNQTVASYDDVLRHWCNNRRCINPDHLEIGTRGENLMDERDFGANGVDHDLLWEGWHWSAGT